MTRLVPALVALVLLFTPVGALAQAPQTNAPAGNSAIDEYLETVPGATGNQRPRSPAAGGTSGADSVLTAAQRARLEKLGRDGKALADAVESTSPPSTTSAKGTAQPATTDGRSPLSQVLGAATGEDGSGGGMGALLPGILLASLLGAILLVVVRRRSSVS